MSRPEHDVSLCQRCWRGRFPVSFMVYGDPDDPYTTWLWAPCSYCSQVVSTTVLPESCLLYWQSEDPHGDGRVLIDYERELRNLPPLPPA